MATRNEKEVRTKWPVVEGLTASTTKQTGQRWLKPEQKTKILRQNMLGIW
jgi:hypothetical protein